MKSKSMVEWSTSEVLPARRSSRNFSVQRRAWHHLLRANPDEHDPVTSTASSPAREQSSQMTRLFKSCSMRSSSDSVKSDSFSRKDSLSQHVRVSQKGLTFDRKRTQKEPSTDQVQLSKKPRHSSLSDHMKENTVSTVAAAVPSEAGLMYRFTENGLVHSGDDAAADWSFLSYR